MEEKLILIHSCFSSCVLIFIVFLTCEGCNNIMFSTYLSKHKGVFPFENVTDVKCSVNQITFLVVVLLATALSIIKQRNI